MRKALVASLGKSPIVITSAVKAFREQKNIQFDEIDILYPEQQIDIDTGIELIEKHCECKNIKKRPLPFEDADTVENCIFFMQALYGVLDERKNDDVYISIAGGRKSMSALMYAPSTFFGNI